MIIAWSGHELGVSGRDYYLRFCIDLQWGTCVRPIQRRMELVDVVAPSFGLIVSRNNYT